MQESKTGRALPQLDTVASAVEQTLENEPALLDLLVQALGVKPDDTLALVLPTSVEMIAAYLAGTQIGCYVTPINHHLVGPEIAYIVDDCDAAALVVDERFAAEAVAAAEAIRLPEERRFAVGAVDGYRPLGELTDGQPATDYAEETFRINSMGADDVLLLVALDDRTDAIWVAEGLDDITPDEVDAIISGELEPRLRDGEFTAAAVATVEGLGEANSAAEEPPPESRES